MIRARFTVEGEPATQGSKRIVQPKGHRRPMLVEQTTKRLKPWRAAVEAEAFIARQRLPAPLSGPLRVSVAFTFRRPTRARKPYPPLDVDKLLRAIGDAMQKGTLIANDNQITSYERVTKRWAKVGQPGGCTVELYDDEL